MRIPTSGKRIVCYGEVLWDILPAGALPGGAPMNVAYHLHKLNRAISVITKVGADSHGRELLDIFSKWGIGTDHFSIDPIHPTGLVYARSNGHHEMAYDIVYPSAWDFITWDDSYTALMQQTDYLVFGSLICRSPASKNTLFSLLESATTTTKVLDINLRPPHFNRPIIEQLLQKTDVLKLNLAELELIAGWYSPVPTVTGKIKLIQERFLINTIVVTMGGDGAVLCLNGDFYEHAGYKVQVADTVGSGDAFLAAFLSQLIDRAPPAEMLDYACAMGALIASYPGACPDYDTREIATLSQFSKTQV
ncbi:carbohydrate kinase [Pseudoflavitalea sp. X16]|uniref:carbohydrate kinase family protein n=1 Tax=Paraflavitalea devenefica TaxID=2716334 RepID=UPI00141D7C0A|nr:carbohydrate kinase [Paraflavitalea devenefica]NII25905.1 carbohydrate kinase [Paraflavitalea devenefica]